MTTRPVTLERLTLEHHAVIEELRGRGPVVRVDAVGAWMVLDRAHAIAVLRDAERFTVDDPRFSTAQIVGPSMLSLDGPEHRRHRDPFVAAFRPSVVVESFGRRLAAEVTLLVETMRPFGSADLVSGLAAPIATASAAMVLGLDAVPVPVLLGWYRRIVHATEQLSLGAIADADRVAAAQAVESLRAAITDAASDPASPLHPVGLVLDDDELASNAAVFLFGAIETTEGMIANLFRHLLVDDRLRDHVRDDRAQLDRAIEESLRLEPAVARVDRYATGDTTLAGARIAAGDLVVVSLAGANRDPAVHERPHEFRLDRAGEPGHLTFVHGPHACIGAHLARIEARAAVDAVLDLLPGLALAADVDTKAVAGVQGVVFRKPDSLDVRWRSGR